MGALAMGRVAIAAGLAVLALGTTACGERSEPTGETATLYPVTVQAGDRPLVVAGPARRIAVLDPASEEILRELGVAGRIVVHPRLSRVDVAALRRAHPDLIVAALGANERALSRAASITHAGVYTTAGDSIRQVEHVITQLGLLTGKPVQARLLVREIERRRREVDAKLAHVPKVTVFVDTGFLTTVSDQSLIGDVLREARGTNVGAAQAGSGPIDSAALAQLDPDVYLVTSDTDLSLQDMRRNTATRRLRAVREGHFVVADANLLQPGPRIGEGLAQVARLLHPDAFR